MATSCMSANPDVSGIGVRVAIYAQNLLCFIPVVAGLWDGNISVNEIERITDQSIGMLSIAFALLITAIVESKSGSSVDNGNLINGFDASVILGLSWMNNTSTFIWLLLFGHHLARNEKERKNFMAIYKDVFSALQAYNQALRLRETEGSPISVSHLIERIRMVNQSYAKLLQRVRVVAFGSIHLSLMSALGLWLWSNPSQFGSHLSCDPSFVIVGVSVPFLSHPLRIISLVVYCLLLIPSLNLIIPLFFFSTIQILCILLYALLLPLWGVVRFCFTHRKPDWDRASEFDIHNMYARTLVPGLIFLFVFNVISVVDIELMLSRNKRLRSSGDDNWGFGQVLAMVLLINPIYDFFVSSFKSIQEARRNVRDRAQNELSKLFTKPLGPLPTNAIIEDIISRGADPNTPYEKAGRGYLTILQLAGYEGRKDLVDYLRGKDVQVNLEVGKNGESKTIDPTDGLVDFARRFRKKVEESDREDHNDAHLAASQKQNADITFFLESVKDSEASDRHSFGFSFVEIKPLKSRPNTPQSAIKPPSDPAEYVCKDISDVVEKMRDDNLDVQAVVDNLYAIEGRGRNTDLADLSEEIPQTVAGAVRQTDEIYELSKKIRILIFFYDEETNTNTSVEVPAAYVHRVLKLVFALT